MLSPSSAVTRPDLRNAVYREWDEAGQVYVADEVLPLVDVEEASATLKKVPIEEELADAEIRRKGDGTYTRSDFEYGQITYDTHEDGHEERVDANTSASAAKWFDAEKLAAQICLQRCVRAHEKAVAAAVFNETTFASYMSSVTTAWGTHATAVPLSDINGAILAVKGQFGVTPNSLVLSSTAWLHLIACDQVLDRLGARDSRDAKRPAVATVAALVDLPRIIIADAYKMTSNPGAATLALASIWSTDYALVAYVPPNPAPGSLTLGLTYHWPGDGSERDWRTEEYYSDERRSTIVRARRQHQAVVREARVGHLLKEVLTKS